MSWVIYFFIVPTVGMYIPRELINIIKQYMYVGRLLDRISSMGIDAREFSAKLHQYGCVVAGGSVVEAIVGGFKNDEKSLDIDVYGAYDTTIILDVNRNDCGLANQLLCMMCRNNPHHPIHPFEHWLWHHIHTRKIKLDSLSGCQFQQYVNDVIIGVRDFKSKAQRLNIQFIMCESDHPVGYCINKLFDLGVCKSTFDGMGVSVVDGTIQFISDVNTKTNVYRGDNEGTIVDWKIEMLYWRYDYGNTNLFRKDEKYHPFDFEWWVSKHGDYSHRLTNDKRANELVRQLGILKRVRKYQRRGFRIIKPF